MLGPKLAKFTRDYPDVVLDITADDSRLYIVAGGFDAGIHFGEYIEKDMIAVRVTGPESIAASLRLTPRTRLPQFSALI